MSPLIILTIILAGLVGLLALGGGVLFLLLKLGVIAHHLTQDDPVDESGGHTLSQSREAGHPASAPKDEA